MNNEKLFTEFPPVTREQWEAVIQKDLKGGDYEKKLIWNTLEGFRVKPYYIAGDVEGMPAAGVAPGQYPYSRGGKKCGNEWIIVQEVYVTDISKANAKAVDAISRGAESIAFIIQEKIHHDTTHLFEVAEDFSKLVAGIDLTKVPLRFIAGCSSPVIISLLDEEITRQGIDASKVRVWFDFDPLGHLTLNGNLFTPEENTFNQMNSLLGYTTSVLPAVKVVGINGYFFRNAGSSLVQELGFSLAVAADYLVRMKEAGADLKRVLKSMHFNFGVGENYFMEIAKIRAARMLWSKIAGTFIAGSEEDAVMDIHSVTIDFNKTVYDPNVNMLRETTEAMAAILGGTDSLLVRPYDAVFANPSDLSERLARNVQIVLKEEAYLNKVADPAGGSYYIEILSQSIANEAWALFLETEDQGGYLEAFKKGFVQTKVGETAKKRDMAIAQKSDIILGTNQYPNQTECMKEKIAGCFVKGYNPSNGKELAEPLKIYRGAAAFEDLRLRTEKMKNAPAVFLLTCGNPAMRKARAGFASNFFGCAGFKIQDNPGFSGPEEGAKAALESGADIVVLCSSDDEYTTIVPAVMPLLKGKAITVLAGFPKDQIEQYKALGIEHFIHIRSNVLETLTAFQKMVSEK